MTSIVPVSIVLAAEPGPTPVPASLVQQYEQGMEQPKLDAKLVSILSVKEASSLAVLFTQNDIDWTYSYRSTSSSEGTNSLQVWCHARRRACPFGQNWYVVDDLWNSTWGTYLTVAGTSSEGGEFDALTKGTHLFDYGNNVWVWRYSEDMESTCWL